MVILYNVYTRKYNTREQMKLVSEEPECKKWESLQRRNNESFKNAT